MDNTKEIKIEVSLTGPDILSHIDHLNQKIADYKQTLEWIYLSLVKRTTKEAFCKGIEFENEICCMLDELFEELKNSKTE